MTTLLLLLILSSLGRTDEPTGPIPGHFVVKLAAGVRPSAVTQALSSGQQMVPASQMQVNAQLHQHETWDRLYRFESTDTLLSADQVADILGRSRIEYVEPVYWLDFYDLPADPLFSNQWYLNNTGQAYLGVERLEGYENDTLALIQGTSGNDIGMAYVYANLAPATTRVVVAVVDTGVDPTHPDLQGRFWHNPDEIPDNGRDDDHNGYIDDIIGYDLSGDSLALFDIHGDNDPTDIIGHGTHIAGIVAAGTNQIGIAGIAEMAEIMAVKIRPNGTTMVGALGIVYAVNAGAQIINVSWGTPFESLILEDAIEFARANGVLVVAAAGNTGRREFLYPAAIPDCFTVAATNSHGYLTSFSTWGPHIDLAAPGQNILSLRAAGTDMYSDAFEPQVHIVGDDSHYYLADGTSMAAPVVAGAAALIWSHRPHLSLVELEDQLRFGARDMEDPLNLGDSLPGPDTICGYGYLDVGNSLQLADSGGLAFLDLIPGNRYTSNLSIKAAVAGNYSGGFTLEYSADPESDQWELLASGDAVPPDLLLHVLEVAGRDGYATLRLSDDYGVSRTIGIILVASARLEIFSPQSGEKYDYNIPIQGFVHGAGYDSALITYRHSTGNRQRLSLMTRECFGSLLYSWNASGIGLGEYWLHLEGYFGDQLISDSVNFTIMSAFAEGWPQGLTGRGALSAVTADLDADGLKEIIVGTTFGLNVFRHNGQPMDGFPVLTDRSTRCLPAIYDVDHDGESEIIVSSDSGMHVFNADGTAAAGWPIKHPLKNLGYGLPTPSVVSLFPASDSAIVFIDNRGDVLAYEFDGSPYFYSLEGWFASFSNYQTASAYFNGNAVSAADLDGDGRIEVAVTYSGTSSSSGVSLFDARSGLPAYGRNNPQVIVASGVFGSILCDLNGDQRLEIITCGYDSTGTTMLWALTDGTQPLDGWPIELPDVNAWLGTFPAVADLDLDGSPEILVSFYEFDVGALYVFNADGTPYTTLVEKAPGQAYVYPATFGPPIIANLMGDQHPEVILRSGYIFPGTGREQVHILDHHLAPVPGWPIATPAPPSQVFSTPYTTIVDDIDGDGLVELVLVSESLTLFVWDFEAEAESGANRGRLFGDNLNSSIVSIKGSATGATVAPIALPRQFNLAANYPNPFNPITMIAFETPVRSFVRLDILNILGQRIQTIVNDELPAGAHRVGFDGSAFASGVYFYRLQAGDKIATRKMVLIK